MSKRAVPFGLWPSPLSAASVAAGGLRFRRLQGAGGALFWSESRPAEQGRSPVLRWDRGGLSELVPPPYSARSRVHEYGGGEFLVVDGELFFVNDADQDIYRREVSRGVPIRRLTSLADTRFGDLAWDGRRNRLICIGETHDPNRAHLPQNALWAIPCDEDGSGRQPTKLIDGRDFYASPRVSPDGTKLAFLAWSLPSMPWDDAELVVAELNRDGAPGAMRAIAGGGASACFQPEWSADGVLYFVWDRDGWGNLFRWREGEPAVQVTFLAGELSKPLWSLNAASYALLEDGRIYLNFMDKGLSRVGVYDPKSGEVTLRDTPQTAIHTLSAAGASAAFVGSSDDEPLSIKLDGAHALVSVRRSSNQELDAGFVGPPRQIEIPGKRGPVYGLLYEPRHPDVEGPHGMAPPMIIGLHGGPTSAATRGLKPASLFFTSRGFAWLDLNYSGSTGYGRDYRLRLNGAWGIADVDDTISAAEFAASEGIADPAAIFISGGSAGGYTVLTTLTKSRMFAGAASYYGISDLVALQKTTHKFEQGYQSLLLGAALEDGETLYRERSALYRAAQIATPLILFQGADDRVVPKEQSLAIAEALRRNGVTVEYFEFEGEGHGFRKAETIRTCLERELDFYVRLINARPAGA